LFRPFPFLNYRRFRWLLALFPRPFSCFPLQWDACEACPLWLTFFSGFENRAFPSVHTWSPLPHPCSFRRNFSGDPFPGFARRCPIMLLFLFPSPVPPRSCLPWQPCPEPSDFAWSCWNSVASHTFFADAWLRVLISFRLWTFSHDFEVSVSDSERKYFSDSAFRPWQ